MPEEEFDLEKRVQERLRDKAREKGLTKLYRIGHPGAHPVEAHREVNKFVKLSREPQARERADWEYDAAKFGYEKPVVKRIGKQEVIYERPKQPPKIQPGETQEQLIARLLKEVESLRKENLELKGIIRGMQE